MSRWDKERKMKVAFELEKLRNIDFNLLWDYLNFELLEVESFEDEKFVRADEFHKYIDELLKSRNDLKKEIIGDD